MRKQVMIDVDGVLSEFTLAFTTVAKTLGLIDKPWSSKEQETYGFKFHVDPVWRYIDQTPNWWMTLQPCINGHDIYLLNEAISLYDVLFVTSRKDGKTHGFDTRYQTYHWLKSMGVDVRNKAQVETEIEIKGPFCKQYGIDVAIDDNVRQLQSLRDYGVRACARQHLYNKEWQPAYPDLGTFLKSEVFESDVR